MKEILLWFAFQESIFWSFLCSLGYIYIYGNTWHWFSNAYKYNLKIVVSYLWSIQIVSCIRLWGRSMEIVTRYFLFVLSSILVPCIEIGSINPTTSNNQLYDCLLLIARKLHWLYCASRGSVFLRSLEVANS